MSIETQIQKKLSDLEEERGFRVLFAAEAGSRAWGFASADSDYDVRFIFVWPKEHYLSVERPCETIDHPIDEYDIDLSGWELRKALALFRKSNGALIEWLFSPIIYRADESVLSEWQRLVLEEQQFVAKRSAAHYFGLVKGMWFRIEKEPEKTTAKRYLYMMRSLLAARYVIDFGVAPPVLITDLLSKVRPVTDVATALNLMIEQKAYGTESDVIGRVSILDELVERELPVLDEKISAMEGQPLPLDHLDPFFSDVLERKTID